MLRRSHKKSKNGCQNCKRRHRKCDETRPECVVCATASIPCSYTVSRRQSPTASSDATTTVSRKIIAGDVDSPWDSDVSMLDNRPTSPTSFKPSVNMLHLELYGNFVTGLGPAFSWDETLPSQTAPLIIAHACSASYLMTEVLALSAQQLSKSKPERSQYYKAESAKLQNEALMIFNKTVGTTSTENIIPAFLFSSVLSLCCFCETFNTPNNSLDDFLDRLVTSIGLFRGIRIMIEGWWEFLVESDIKALLRQQTLEPPIEPREDNIRKGFEKLRIGIVHSSSLTLPQSKVCEEAIRSLSKVYKMIRVDAEGNAKDVPIVTAWPTLVTSEYTDLLVQRKPEALIVLAYYSILLNLCHRFWAIGDSGQVLFDALKAYLDHEWQHWLEWPQAILSGQTDASPDA